jgi:DNA modification methylase
MSGIRVEINSKATVKKSLNEIDKSLNYNSFKYEVENFTIRKVIDETWDFRRANTKEFTHCFHSYPAMMIPQVARRILEKYAGKSKVLFDPYCGSGTSLVEANLKGINAVGTDINPLARLISKSKTTKIDVQVLDLFLQDFNNFIFSINFQVDRIKSVIIPNVKNIDYWFSKSVQQKLGIIRAYIESINNISIRNFFNVAFSETVRECSYVKKGEFKLVRSKNFHKKEEVDVFGMMISKLSRNKKGLLEFMQSCNNETQTSVYDFNTVEKIPTNIIKPNSIDIVITSPPYGDSRTTVAYGQFSRLANEWLGYREANQIDNISMGGQKAVSGYIFRSDLLNDVVETIYKIDSDRGRDVIAFYQDYEKSINHVSAAIKKGGYACYVVGNRTVKGITIPTDEITAQLFIENNFTHIETIIRNIPNKRMPSKNSPSNVAGVTSTTMSNEFIVICQKN